MVLPVGPSPSRARCASCAAPYVHGQPFAHAAGCPQGGRGVTVATLPEPKPADAGLAAELALAERLNGAGLVGWEPQFFWALDERSAAGRPIQYRADFAFVKARVLVESEGGAHTVRRQHAVDCHRTSLAAALGWRMVRVTKDMIVDDGPHGAIGLVRRALAWGRGA